MWSHLNSWTACLQTGACDPYDSYGDQALMFVILLTANFRFRNRSTCSEGTMKRAGKICGHSQDLKSPGSGYIEVKINKQEIWQALSQSFHRKRAKSLEKIFSNLVYFIEIDVQMQTLCISQFQA